MFIKFEPLLVTLTVRGFHRKLQHTLRIVPRAWRGTHPSCPPGGGGHRPGMVHRARGFFLGLGGSSSLSDKSCSPVEMLSCPTKALKRWAGHIS